MIGAAASAVSSGSAVYKHGKLDASWLGPFDQVVTAGEVAVGDMGMHLRQTHGDAEEGVWKIVAADDHNEKVVIHITRQTPVLTEFQINVGWFGHESTARLLLKRMALAIELGADEDGTGAILPAPVLAVPDEEPAPTEAETPPPATTPDETVL